MQAAVAEEKTHQEEPLVEQDVPQDVQDVQGNLRIVRKGNEGRKCLSLFL